MATTTREERLRERITNDSARVCVIGQGYVGLSVASAAALAGMNVVGVDVDGNRIEGLIRGQVVVPGIDEASFLMAFDSGRLHFSIDPSVASHADVVLICVPTPVSDHRPDLSYVESAARSLAPHLQRGSLVVLESTTYPGTTEQILKPLLESGGCVAGQDFFLAYSPERIDPGNSKYNLANTPRVVAGIDPPSGRMAAIFYERLVEEVRLVSSCRAAELTKLHENTFRMVNIALVNELAIVCSEQGIDPWEVIEAAATKPFGFMPFYPGPGIGGHCIPLDPEYLAWQSRRDTGQRFRLVELAQDINAGMPPHVAARVAEALNDHGKALRGARILALGVSYKPDVGDTRESAAIQVLQRLHRRGASVSFHDPFIGAIDLEDGLLEGIILDEHAVATADCVVLLTPHTSYDVQWLVRHAQLLFDARNATRDCRAPNVVLL